MSQPALTKAARRSGASRVRVRDLISVDSPFIRTIRAPSAGRSKLMHDNSRKIRHMDPYVPLPPLPERLGRLSDLACDLWWSWNAEAREVFRDLDYPLWRFTDHNPVLLLHLVESERLPPPPPPPPRRSASPSAPAPPP